MNKSNTPGWGAAQLQIREAVHFLCAGKSASERAEIAEELGRVDIHRIHSMHAATATKDA